MPDPTTEELRLDQIQRASEERARAEEADHCPEEQKAERRAVKADYLSEKLAERAKAEDEAAPED